MSEMLFFFFSSRRRHTRYWRDWSSDVCSSDLRYPRGQPVAGIVGEPDGVVEVAGPNDGEDGTEDLLLRGLRTVVHVGHDGRGDVEAIVLRTGGSAIEYDTSLVLGRLQGIENTVV